MMVGLLLGCTKAPIEGSPENQELCENVGGGYNAKFNECVDISEEACLVIGGEWDGCASPCRNDPGADVCILSCALVCYMP